METQWCESCDKFQPVRSGRCISCRSKVANERGSLKVWKVAVLLLVAGLVFYIYYLPYAAANKLKMGIKYTDPLLLEETIDFPSVRDSLRSQLNVAFMTEMKSDESLQDNPFAGLALAIGSGIVDRMVETAITPDGMAMLLNEGRAKAGEGSGPEDFEPLGGADMGYESSNTFIISNPSEHGEVKLIMRREGLTWKVRRMDIPMDMVTKHVEGP